MNELTELKEAWRRPDPPSSTAQETARAALMGRIAAASAAEPVTTRSVPARRGWRGARLRWLTGATAAAAVAAAVAFVVVPGTPQPEGPPGQVPGGASGQVSAESLAGSSGPEILLAAATAAEARPGDLGTYWRLKLRLDLELYDEGQHILESWNTHDGYGYVWSGPDGGVLLLELGSALTVAGSALTLEQLEQLPTDPDALTAWIVDSYADPVAPPPAPDTPAPPVLEPAEVPEAELPGRITTALTTLLYEVPAPPAVRAAAFRALASMPNVTNLGPVDGGLALQISSPPPDADKFPDGELPPGIGEQTLVVDPETSMLISVTNYTGTTEVLEAEWTDEIPEIVEPPAR